MATNPVTDDITITTTSNSIDDARNSIQQYLNELTAWLNKWKFLVNPRKCLFQICTRKHNLFLLNIHRVKWLTFLGSLKYK